MKKSKDITVCSIGDSSTRQGEFYESVCFAVQEQLPIIFLVEDNGYGISTKNDKFNPVNLKIFDRKLLNCIDGRDAQSVYKKAKKVIADIRKGKGPVVLWASVDRLQSHTLMDDHRRYRSKEEINNLIDPIEVFERDLIKQSLLSAEEIDERKLEIKEKVKNVYEDIGSRTSFDFVDIQQNLYSSASNGSPELMVESGQKPDTILAAFNKTLRKGLSTLPNSLLLGEDIEDPKGGVFGITEGLSSDFPGRVFNSPLAEATILGTAIGLSFQGFKPVCEIQFIDFISPAFNQINTNLGNLSWRSMGEWQCPLILYAPYGAYLPGGGIWHSESNESLWTHIPGLRVVIPSRPSDAEILLAKAFSEDTPTLFLLPKHLMRIEQPSGNCSTVEFGQANTLQEGDDITLVTWGNCVELALNAVDAIKEEGFSIELIDLISLVPCDWQTIQRSLQKTGRLIVLHEDNRTSSFGASIVAEIISNIECFESLYTAPELIARNDVPIAFNPQLEKRILPSIDDVIESIYRVMNLD